ncbi:MAG: hypothetical protein Q4C75_07030, partial [Bergeyella zoohelcum]|nr:hypothetical protein [Bergeyella zoohelcum]
MKKFILKTFIFLGILTSILGVIYSYLYLKEKPKIKLSKKNIIIGDSNTRWSIDDKILSTYANYSTGGETYLFAYTKLKLLSKDNKIDTLLLSFNNHNIINNMWWNDNDGTPLDNRMPAFYQDFSLQEHWDLFSHTPKTYYKSLLKI